MSNLIPKLDVGVLCVAICIACVVNSCLRTMKLLVFELNMLICRELRCSHVDMFMCLVGLMELL